MKLLTGKEICNYCEDTYADCWVDVCCLATPSVRMEDFVPIRPAVLTPNFIYNTYIDNEGDIRISIVPPLPTE